MPNRILKESICTSENIDSLKNDEEILFYRIIVNCDDYGRMDARLPIIKAKCFPLKVDKIKDKELIKWLNALIEKELTILYQIGDRTYLQMTTWEKHQQIRAKRSKFPGISDGGIGLKSYNIKRNQMKSNVPVIQSNPIQSESNPNPIQSSLEADFEEFWKLYPKRVNKAKALKQWIKLMDSKKWDKEQLLQCATNYGDLVKREKRESKYIKYAEGFLNPDNKIFEDYLPENYKGGEQSGASSESDAEHKNSKFWGKVKGYGPMPEVPGQGTDNSGGCSDPLRVPGTESNGTANADEWPF